MKGYSMQQFLKACLFASLVLTGCSHAEKQRQASSVAPPLAARNLNRGRVYPSNQSVVVQPAVAAPPRTIAVTEESPVPLLPAETPVITAGDGQPAQQAGSEEIKTCAWRGEPAPVRKSYVDITSQPSFSHAPDYSWVSGELQHWQATKSWRLRYSSVDEADPYGGSVTLVGGERQLELLKDGQSVRVQGALLHQDAAGSAPPYQVESIQPLQR